MGIARTVAWVLDWFQAHDAKLRSPVARKERRRVLALFAAFHNRDGRTLGELLITEAIGADLVEFLDARCQGAQWTRRRWCATVKRPFHAAQQLGLIQSSPFAAVTETRGERGRDLTWDEFRSLLRNSNPAMRRVLIFLRWTGARPEELRTLEWPHVDWAHRQILKRTHKTAHATGKPRVIQLAPPVLALLRWIQRHHPHGGKFVFVNSFGGQWRTHAMCKYIRTIRAKLGMPDDVKLYGTRHAFCTEAIMQGLDVATVAELAGHASISTTQTYLHLSGKKDHLRAAMERAVAFNGGQTREQSDLAKALALLQALVERSGSTGGKGP